MQKQAKYIYVKCGSNKMVPVSDNPDQSAEALAPVYEIEFQHAD
jgi:hypothetical protein